MAELLHVAPAVLLGEGVDPLAELAAPARRSAALFAGFLAWRRISGA